MKINDSVRDTYIEQEEDILHRKYIYNEMTGILDAGNLNYQNDSLILMEKNGIKLLAIADGLKERNNNIKSSAYCLRVISYWFKNINYDILTSPLTIYKDIKEVLEFINNELKNKNGTTLSLAIILKDETIILQVGDSRIYLSDNDKTCQIMDDQSYAWYKYVMGEIKTKDNIRYFRFKDIMRHSIGENELLEIDYNIINNNEYNKIFMFTEGITNILTENELISLIDEYKNCEDKIINTSLKYREVNDTFKTSLYNKEINGGSYNTSLVSYKKKVKK